MPNETVQSEKDSGKTARLLYVDWLRVILILGVFLYHALKPFSMTPWHINNAEESVVIFSIMVWAWPWALPLFFLVAGAASLFALRRRSNRQYVSVGNLMTDDRVSLFFMDYPNQTRLKLLGRARFVASDETAMLEKLAPADYKARVERGLLITVEAFDWNCPQHITPRFTAEQVEDAITPLRARIAKLEAQLQKEPSAS